MYHYWCGVCQRNTPHSMIDKMWWRWQCAVCGLRDVISL